MLYSLLETLSNSILDKSYKLVRTNTGYLLSSQGSSIVIDKLVRRYTLIDIKSAVLSRYDANELIRSIQILKDYIFINKIDDLRFLLVVPTNTGFKILHCKDDRVGLELVVEIKLYTTSNWFFRLIHKLFN